MSDKSAHEKATEDRKADVFKDFLARLNTLSVEDRAAVIRATAIFYDVRLDQ